MKFNISACTAAVALATAVRGIAVSDVLTDIGTLCTRATTLKNAVSAFAGTLSGVLTLHNNNVALLSQVVTTTADTINVVPAPVAATDANAICTALTGSCTSSLQLAFNGYVTIAPAVAALGSAGTVIIKQDLINLDSGITALEGALGVKLAASAAALMCLDTFQATVNPSVDAAVAAY